MMHISMILDPDACVYDASVNDAQLHISIILDPDACIYDATNLSRTNGPTNKPILGVGSIKLEYKHNS